MFGETAWGNQYAYRTTQSGALAPEARVIAKGRLGEPVEYDHNAQIVEGEDGVIVTTTSSSPTPPTHHSWRPRPSGSSSEPGGRTAGRTTVTNACYFRSN
jgi:hypothetical protein